MRVDSQSNSIDKIASLNSTVSQASNTGKAEEQKSSVQEKELKISKDQLQRAVDSVNKFLGINHSELKFVFHEGLEQYFVQLVDSETDEVVREIPPKKLLDGFYEMQKLAGMIIDKKI